MPPIFSQKFRARPMLEYIEPAPVKNYKPKGYQPLIDDFSNIMDRFEDVDEQPVPYISKSEMKAKLKKEKMITNVKRQKEEIRNYRPDEDSKIRGDPYKTIFVSKLNFETDEKIIEK
jgi:U1 small nuclear ribonucleoprotein